MRWMVLALVLAGCDAGGLVTQELPSSPPPPTAIAPGTLVVTTWQFRNLCKREVDVTVTTGNFHVIDVLASGMVQFSEFRCLTGDETCAKSPEIGFEYCAPCAPGTFPPLEVRCD